MTDKLIGTYLGQYHLVEVIGRGGMSTIYKAYQESLDRVVAVKVLLTTHNPQFVQRFKTEARAIARLQHANILPIHNYGEQDGLLYLVLQYVEGGVTLNDMLGAPMEPVRALQLTGRLLAALEYAHARGVIHRDIKPANVLMPEPNWPLLADFGIAKSLNESDPQLTTPGMIMGTAAYVAPEQVEGQPVDGRADVYSTGVVLYEMLTGRVPFEGPPSSVVSKKVSEPPPAPRQFNPALPASIEAVLLRALARDPGDRYQSARAMADDLEQIATQIEQRRASARLTSLYQAGLQAFEHEQWEQAVEQLSQLVALDPNYRGAAALLMAAQVAQEHANDASGQSRPASQGAPQQQHAEPLPVPVPAPDPADPPTMLMSAGTAHAGVPSSAPEPSAAGAVPRNRNRPLPPILPPRLGSGRAPLAVGVLALVAILLVASVVVPNVVRRSANGAAVSGATAVASGLPATTAAPVAAVTATAPVASAVPTAASASATTAPVVAATAAPTGTLTWQDRRLWNDSVTVSIKGLPALEAGQAYAAWLANNEHSLALGSLKAGEGGDWTLTYDSPTHANLLAAYDRIYITEVPEAAAQTEVANIIMAGALPGKALVHIRHILSRFDTTPHNIGFVLGLRQEADELLRHAELVKHAYDQGRLPWTRQHTEHMINIIEGGAGNDYDGNGKVENPGDGFGILGDGQQRGYVQFMAGHAVLAAGAADATEGIKRHAAAVEVISGNTRGRVEDIRSRAQRIIGATDMAALGQDVQAVLDLSNQVIQGADINQNGQVEPIRGEGGVLTAYQQAQLMATVPITAVQPGTIASGPPPAPPVPEPAPPLTINVSDNAFAPEKITIPAGTTVEWTNGGGAHTVTAEDKSFVSGTVPSNQSFRFTFSQPGYFPYYCEFHGGPHGEGMSGIIIVK